MIWIFDLPSSPLRPEPSTVAYMNTRELKFAMMNEAPCPARGGRAWLARRAFFETKVPQ